MASIDDLTIQINTTASDSEQALNALASNLEKMGKALSSLEGAKGGIKTIRSLGSALRSLTKSANMDYVVSSIVNLGKAVARDTAPISNYSNILKELTKSMRAIGKVNAGSFTEVSYGIRDIGYEINKLDIERLRAFADIASHLSDIKDFKAWSDSMREAAQSATEAQNAIVPYVKTLEQASEIPKAGDGDGFVKPVDPATQDNLEELNDATAKSIEKLLEMAEAAAKAQEKLKDAFKGLEGFTPTVLKDGEKYSQAYRELESSIRSASKELANLVLRGEKMSDLGASEKAWKELAYNIDLAKEKLAEYLSQMQELQAGGGDIIEAPQKVEQSADALENLAATAGKLGVLSRTIGQVAQEFDKIGNAGIKAMTSLYKVAFSGILDEFKKKISGISSALKSFSKSMKGTLDKLIGFWNKAFQRFTFTLLRKAINAIINDLGAAMVSLANFAEETGRTFNRSVSAIVSDAKYIGASLVAAFAPIANTVAPILDYLTDKLVIATNALNAFFAALGGASSFAVAKKGVTDFAKSMDKASGSSKTLKNNLLGIDEINVFNPDKDKSGAGAEYDYQWEQFDISDNIKGMADKVKDIFEKLFDPLKKAWDKAGRYVTAGFKKMIRNLKELAGSIGKDFLAMWQQEATEKIFENILGIIGDLEDAIATLAGRFRKAWEANGVGISILERIRDIMGTIVTHARNVSQYMKEWAEGIDFSPLLNAFDGFLESANKVVDFLGGVFEDVMERVVLRHIEWMIETGLPHLMETLSEVFDSFEFDKIREDLKPLEDAIANLAESIDTGLVNALGNIGKALAGWTNSEEFTKFMQSIADIMNEITAERVEKFFTALGTAILDIVKALAKFVSSDGFQKFIWAIGDWFDNHSSDDIADLLEKIAMAIIGFKFTAFAGKGAANFLGFIAKLSALKDLHKIAGGLAGTGTAAQGAASGLGAVASAAAPIAAAAAGIVVAVYSMIQSFDGIGGLVEELKTHFDRIKGWLDTFAKDMRIPEHIEALKEAFGRLNDALGGLASYWKMVYTAMEPVITFFAVKVMSIFNRVVIAITAVINAISGLIEILGGFADVIYGVFTGDMQTVADGFEKIWQGVTDIFNGFINGVIATVEDFVGKIIGFFENLKYQLIGDPIVIDMWNGIVKVFTDGIKSVVDAIAGFVTDIVNKFIEIKDDVLEKVKELQQTISQKLKDIGVTVQGWLTGIKQKFTSFSLKSAAENIINGVRSGFSKAWSAVSTWVNEKINWIKNKFSNIKISLPSFGSSGVQSIRGYATGGFPEDGLFYANHGELVGQFSNGQTAVANNSQIISGIEGGVERAMSRAMSALSGMGGGTQTLVVELDGREIYRSVVNQNNSQIQRTGASPLFA